MTHPSGKRLRFGFLCFRSVSPSPPGSRWRTSGTNQSTPTSQLTIRLNGFYAVQTTGHYAAPLDLPRPGLWLFTYYLCFGSFVSINTSLAVGETPGRVLRRPDDGTLRSPTRIYANRTFGDPSRRFLHRPDGGTLRSSLVDFAFALALAFAFAFALALSFQFHVNPTVDDTFGTLTQSPRLPRPGLWLFT